MNRTGHACTMSVAQPTKGTQPKRARSRTPGGKAVPSRRAKISESPLEPNDVDQFKFRIVARNGKHFFTEVRFTPPNGREDDIKTVVNFFEGQCLEVLDEKTIAAFLAPHPIVPRLWALVDELQQVLCD